MFKQYPRIKNKWGNKSHQERPGERYKFSIRVDLMRINKIRLIENTAGYENGYRFHSYDSQVFPTIRTQSTTIPNYASPNRLYIYKKWKCVDLLTVTRYTLTVKKDHAILGTSINFSQRLLFIHHHSQSEGGGNLH